MPTLELTDWKVSYQESGVGLPVIFIPGITEYKESFDFQLRGLSDRYRVISYDVRSASDGGMLSIEALATDLCRLMEALRLSSSVIVGHSFGGLIAQQFAQMYPDRTASLVLISTFAKAPDHNSGKLMRLMSSGKMSEPESAWKRFKISLGMEKPETIAPEEFLGWVSMQSAKTTQATVQSRLDAIKHFNSLPWLEHLWKPLLIISGELDRTPILSAAQMLYRATADSALEVVPGVGHFSHIERHDMVNQFIDDFVGKRLVSLVE